MVAVEEKNNSFFGQRRIKTEAADIFATKSFMVTDWSIPVSG